MPDVRFADPRLLGGNLGSLVPAFAQGVELGESIRMAPMRRQLADIQLQEAENRLSMAPIEQQLAQLRLGEAQRSLAIPVFRPGDVAFEDTTVEYPAAIDEFGNRTGPSDVIPGDLVRVTQGMEYGPGGLATPTARRETVKTAAQRAEEAALKEAQIEATRALATQRNRGKDYEFTRLAELRDDALAAGDAEGAAMYDSRIKRLTQLNPEFRTVASGVDDKGQLIINQVDAAGNLRAIPTGQKKSTANDWATGILQAMQNLPQKGGVAAPVAAPVVQERFEVGKTYTDASGNRATYLGNGQWREAR